MAENVFGGCSVTRLRGYAGGSHRFTGHGGGGRPLYGYGEGHPAGVELRVVHIWEVRDGKIARFRQFADTAKFLEVVPAEIATG